MFEFEVYNTVRILLNLKVNIVDDKRIFPNQNLANTSETLYAVHTK